MNAPPPITSRTIHKIILSVLPVFGEAVFIGLFVWSAELLSEEAVFIGLS